MGQIQKEARSIKKEVLYSSKISASEIPQKAVETVQIMEAKEIGCINAFSSQRWGKKSCKGRY